MNRSDLITLDINKLFEERSIDEIIEIEKSLDAEIERKRNDLRSMVGDRYKDILAASDAIKCMKNISEEIVLDIDAITKICEKLMEAPKLGKIDTELGNLNSIQKDEERVLLIQLRLSLFLIEQIWISLDAGFNLKATEYYLLAQHIFTGLNLSKKEYLNKLLILQHLKLNIQTLKRKIFEKITVKLESVEITPDEISSNLNALMLLENENSEKLLRIFIEHRKTALNTVMNSQFSSVKMQISSMVKCTITTVLLLHDCFINNQSKNGLLWKELNNIIGDNSVATIYKLELPATPLIAYIPDLIKEFRPKIDTTKIKPISIEKSDILIEWLKSTQEIVEKGLEKNLLLVTTVKGLNLIREEALKINLNESWPQICKDLNLPDNFNVWYYFFQNLTTKRAQNLISTIIANILKDIEKSINNLKISSKEIDLRSYAWKENNEDVCKMEKNHTGLTMKSKGYSLQIVNLCKHLDSQFLTLLEDISQYLYGIEYSEKTNYLLNDFKFKRKFVDRENLEKFLMEECVKNSLKIPNYVSESTENSIIKSIFYARFLQAICQLCKNFRKCCEFYPTTSEWNKLVEEFNKISQKLWMNWVNDCVMKTRKEVEIISKEFAKWDNIEIFEQTEEQTFKSFISIPLKPSIHITKILVQMNNSLSEILAYTVPKIIHLEFLENNLKVILNRYEEEITIENNLNQVQSLQFLFDIRFLTTLCIPKDNQELIKKAQNICDKLRGKIDPFDLDVFYSHLQNNVKKAISQSQVLFGCLLPSSAQLINLGSYTKNKEPEKPSLLALSSASSNLWFSLLPITVPSQKVPDKTLGDAHAESLSGIKSGTAKKSKETVFPKKPSTASLFGNFSTDWFS